MKSTLSFGVDTPIDEIRSVTGVGAPSVSKINNYEYKISSGSVIGGGIDGSGIKIYLNNKNGVDLSPSFTSSMDSITISIMSDPVYYSNVDIYVDDVFYKSYSGSTSKIVISGLIPSKDYKIRIRGQPNKSFSAVYDKVFTVSTKDLEFTVDQEVTYDSNTITFSKVNLANIKFQIRFNNNIYDVLNNKHVLDSLEPEKAYSFEVRFTLDGQFSSWKKYNFKTLEYEGVPVLNDFTIVSVSHDKISVQVNSLYGKTYEWYLDGRLINTTGSKTYIFDGLEPETLYRVNVDVINDFGVVNSEVLEATTLTTPNGFISGLTASIIDSDSLSRLLNWTSNYVKDSIHLVIGDNAPIVLSKDVTSYTVDFASLGYTKEDSVKVSVYPTDKDSKGSSILVDLSFDGVGDAGIDQIIPPILNGIGLMLRAGVFLILSLIKFIIPFFAIRWLFKIFKSWISSSNSDKSQSDGSSNSGDSSKAGSSSNEGGGANFKAYSETERINLLTGEIQRIKNN